ncbi:hypothetical protein RD149_01915 [Gordonia westfalica]|uniref:Uncharacterized protein n=1 Tax=Gordonia westfalica TaxID=158898 RepID=A0ABU2GM22_9ACTN|nr:hypothetical protein [Gordonia westfalica]MDS1112516.1 hypothetical protein [Gordonia westfalica]
MQDGFAPSGDIARRTASGRIGLPSNPPKGFTVKKSLSAGFAAVSILLSAAVMGPVPDAHAAGMVTIFPNYVDSNCGMKGFAIQHVKVAATPGGTRVNANNQRWARISVPSRGRVVLTAQLQCQNVRLKQAVQWVTVQDSVTNAQAWKSYYF